MSRPALPRRNTSVPIKNAFYLLFGLSGLACASADDPRAESHDTQLRLAYLQLGMSEPLADTCVALQRLAWPARDPGAPSHDAPVRDPLRDTRREFLQTYCEEYSP